MQYKPLPTEFDKFGFHFKQIWREGDYAIYEQTKEGHAHKNWEAIRIRRHDGFQIAGNEIEPKEIYPSNERWGDDGFTLTSIEDARAKIKVMQEYVEPEKKRGRGRPKGSKNKKK